MKHLVLIFFFSIFLFAKESSFDYEVTFGFLGKIAHIKIVVVEDKSSYSIKGIGKTEGAGEYLSMLGTSKAALYLKEKKEEYFFSKGVIENNRFKPSLFEIQSRSRKKVDIKNYKIDFLKKKIEKTISKIVNNKKQRLFIKEKKYLGEIDIFSLLIDLPSSFYQLREKKVMKKRVLGSKSSSGFILIKPLTVNQLKKENIWIKKGNSYFRLIMNQKILTSENGEFILSYNSKNHLEYIIMKNILGIGDIVAREFSFKEKEK